MNEAIKLASCALKFLELDAKYVDASVRAKAEPHNDYLYKLAHSYGEERETARRILADRLIEIDPSLHDQVRRSVKFSHADVGKGTAGPANVNRNYN